MQIAVEVGGGVLFGFSVVAAFEGIQSLWGWIKMRQQRNEIMMKMSCEVKAAYNNEGSESDNDT